jgi:hypothetical protein
MIRNGILALVGLMFIAATCEKPVDINIADPGPKLVLICNFTEDNFFKVQISKTQAALSSNTVTEYIGNATVEIWQGNQLKETLSLVTPPNGDPPYYTSSRFQPQIGIEYTIKAKADGFPLVQAMNSIPAPVPIVEQSVRDLQIIPTSKTGENNYNYTVVLRFLDPMDQENYYHLNFYQKINNYKVVLGDTIISSTDVKTLALSPDASNNFQVASFNGGLLLEDKPFNGRGVTLTFPVSITVDTKQAILGNLDIELRSVSKEYYLYLSSISRQQSNPNVPYAEPVILFNNIKNGQGIFAGFSKSKTSLVIGR